jgi:peroxiredoxin
MIRRPEAAALAAVLTAGLALQSSAGAEMTALRRLIRPGEKAPAFTLKDMDGKSASFRPGDGKPALVLFWSAFCPLCREFTRDVGDMVRRHGSAVRVVSVNLDGKRFSNAVSSFIRENDIRYPVLLDDVRNDFFIASDPYGVEKTPTAVLVDGGGVVFKSYEAEGMRILVRNYDQAVLDLKKRHTAKK